MIHQQLKSVSNVLIGLDTNDGAGVKVTSSPSYSRSKTTPGVPI